MAAFGNRFSVFEAVNFVESQFPNAMAPQPTCSEQVFPQAFPQNYPQQQPQQAYHHLSPPGVPAGQYRNESLYGPPPGLVRVSPQVPAPIRRFTNENTSLFGDFARYLDKGVDENGCQVCIDLTCVICLERKLRVTDDPAPEDTEPLAVLPCGHFFGGHCLASWLDEEFENNIVPCPMCRFEMVYDCGHDIAPRLYNPAMLRRDQIPTTFPEGGMVPRCCPGCYDGKIGVALERLRHYLYPDFVIPGDLKHPNSAEIMRDASLRFRGRVWDLMADNEQYIRW